MTGVTLRIVSGVQGSFFSLEGRLSFGVSDTHVGFLKKPALVAAKGRKLEKKCLKNVCVPYMYPPCQLL